MTFEQATALLPMCLYGGLDIVGQHKTLADLRFMAIHELDLYIEGEIELTGKERREIREFLARID